MSIPNCTLETSLRPCKQRKKLVFTDEEIYAEATRLFRLLHGPGDSGSEFEYGCQNPAMIKGWERIAVQVLELQERVRQGGGK